MPLRLVELEVEPSSRVEVLLRHLVDDIDRGCRLERGERRAPGVGEAVLALRREVRVAVVVLAPADVGRERRIELGERVDPCLGDLVDRRGSAGGSSHDLEPMTRRGPADAGPGLARRDRRRRSISAPLRSSRLRDRSARRAAPSAARRRPCASRTTRSAASHSPSATSTTSSSWICISTRERSPSESEVVVDVEQRDLHDVGGAALDGRVERRALGVLAQHAVGAREVGEGAPAAEDRLGVAVDAGPARPRSAGSRAPRRSGRSTPS